MRAPSPSRSTQMEWAAAVATKPNDRSAATAARKNLECISLPSGWAFPPGSRVHSKCILDFVSPSSSLEVLVLLNALREGVDTPEFQQATSSPIILLISDVYRYWRSRHTQGQREDKPAAQSCARSAPVATVTGAITARCGKLEPHGSALGLEDGLALKGHSPAAAIARDIDVAYRAIGSHLGRLCTSQAATSGCHYDALWPLFDHARQ